MSPGTPQFGLPGFVLGGFGRPVRARVTFSARCFRCLHGEYRGNARAVLTTARGCFGSTRLGLASLCSSVRGWGASAPWFVSRAAAGWNGRCFGAGRYRAGQRGASASSGPASYWKVFGSVLNFGVPFGASAPQGIPLGGAVQSALCGSSAQSSALRRRAAREAFLAQRFGAAAWVLGRGERWLARCFGAV